MDVQTDRREVRTHAELGESSPGIVTFPLTLFRQGDDWRRRVYANQSKPRGWSYLHLVIALQLCKTPLTATRHRWQNRRTIRTELYEYLLAAHPGDSSFVCVRKPSSVWQFELV